MTTECPGTGQETGDRWLSRLAVLDTGAISDALDRLGLPGAILGLSRLSGAQRIVGCAITVKLGPADGTPTTRHLCTAAVDASSPRNVIVIDNGGRVDAAGWGGILSYAAAQRGVAGVIIDGACRDLDEVRHLGLTLYARAAVPVSARGRVIEQDWNTAVEVSGISVAPGDYVVGDASGVVAVPEPLAEAVITTAESIAHREQRMIDRVGSGLPVREVMGADYEQMLGEHRQ